MKVAVVQASPVLFDCDATLDKTEHLVSEAAGTGAELVLLPEAFIPAYPRGLSFGTVVGQRSLEGRRLFQRYFDEAFELSGASFERLSRIVKQANVFVAIGVVEKDPSGTLYCTLLYFDNEGELVGKHRKIKPTAAERLIWGEGDGSTLTVVDTSFGRVGGLICWENYMPLARMAMYGKAIDIYLAPTADDRDRWQATMRHIALEGRCFVLGCNQFVTKSMYPAGLENIEDLETQEEIMCRGGSVIVSPLGEVIEGPLYDREGILLADLDLSDIARAKFDFDVVGHYARPDIFELRVNDKAMKSVSHISDSL